jgi:hypothetical protein
LPQNANNPARTFQIGTLIIKRRAAGETLAEIAKFYAVDISMISRLKA